MNSRPIFFLSLALVAAWPVSALAQPSRLDPDSVAQRIEMADLNRDGMVTRQEFLSFRSQSFSKFDRNHDGSLSAADLPAFARQSERGEAFLKMMETFDRNHDGRVSRTEFVNGPTPVFDNTDTNANGVIDGYELKQLKAKG
ncbi:EF-hand domain-containing protein [Asticcacaulis sp. DW145]|uniref:EF-hand domain-containing protein n=1 Tax=Asticcacaulis sp. DW145 TaxID=3095608 RepID=UPI00308E8384|nr:EF-hand domain-containing protein [Asticcacaulis sp. DW145]